MFFFVIQVVVKNTIRFYQFNMKNSVFNVKERRTIFIRDIPGNP